MAYLLVTIAAHPSVCHPKDRVVVHALVLVPSIMVYLMAPAGDLQDVALKSVSGRTLCFGGVPVSTDGGRETLHH